MKKQITFILSILVFGILPCVAQSNVQKNNSRIHNKKDSSVILKMYTDSLSILKSRLDSLCKVSDSLRSDDIDGTYYKLFVPLTFYHSVANDAFLYNGDKDKTSENKAINDVLMNIYLNRPDLVRGSENLLNKSGHILENMDRPIRHNIILSKKTAPQPAEPDILPVGVLVKRPNFWTITGDYYLQFLQNYVSDNWYKGGESNYSMVGSVTMQANYNNKSKLKFDNKLELKLGFQSSQSDSLHKFKTTEDLIRYTGKIGLQATKSWYYTFQLLTYTQFTRGYKSNDNNVYSDLMSPFNLNLSVGMNYTVKTKNSVLTGNINLAPLAYNFRYVGRLALATRYSLDEGHHVLNDFGSEFTVDLVWNVSDLIKWKTRLYGYTTYKRAELEWENTLSFILNKYISTNIFLYPRFDDSVAKDGDNSYWQFKEYASVGFAYSF